MGFVTDVRLLFRAALLIQMRHSLGDPVILTVDCRLAFLLFQLLPRCPIVDTATQGRNRTGFGLASVSSRLFERGLLRVQGLQAGCGGRVRQEPLRQLTVPGAAGGIALLLEPRGLIHDAHERSVARPVLRCAALHRVNSLVFNANVRSLALEAVGKTAA